MMVAVPCRTRYGYFLQMSQRCDPRVELMSFVAYLNEFYLVLLDSYFENAQKSSVLSRAKNVRLSSCLLK